ncbi:substrate-binding domain-containing protein [Maritimibacter sp. DP07]|uniref:Substrate-binding domain-containing protein n=2 Tax=Maritimibacter harenae TaxID=2606218 RepID=A0A845M4V3_9RHOB|nr:substrate-binding domain-containing protein [Maritimibacter harenae]
MRKTLKNMSAIALATMLPLSVLAQSGEDLMESRLGTTDANPAIVDAFERAAREVTPELREKALECWNEGSCDTGTGGEMTVALADGFGENVWRRVTAMEYVQQALTYPEIGRILYSSARGDAAKAISDLRSYVAQGVDVIVIFADHGEALGPTVREAQEAGIQVAVYGGTEVGTAGEDYVANVTEDICELGAAFIDAIEESNPDAQNVVALGGTPGNPLSATVQRCATERTEEIDGLELVAAEDTNWTQEGTFSATSALLSRFDDIDAYISEYADGFRGALRAYESADRPMDFTLSVRTDEQGLFCEWEDSGKSFQIFYASGQNYQSRIALTAAMRAAAGEAVDAHVDVPFAMSPVEEGLCNRELPMEVSVSTLVDEETLKAMFGG